VCKQVLKHISILVIALWRKTFWFTVEACASYLQAIALPKKNGTISAFCLGLLRVKNTKLEKKSLFTVIDDAEAIKITGSLKSVEIKIKCRFDAKPFPKKGVLIDVIPSTIA
jgi:hypothetical protein